MFDAVERRERQGWRAEEPSWALWEVMRTSNDAAHAMARRMNLPLNDVRALEALSDSANGLGTVELANRLGMRSASAAELVDRLESSGHVLRAPHATDRRRVVVGLTEQGRTAALAAIGPMLARFDRLARELGDDAEIVTRYLRAVAAEQRAYCAE